MARRMRINILLATALCLLLSFPVSAAPTGSLAVKKITAPVTLFCVADAQGTATEEFAGALTEQLTDANMTPATAKQLQKYTKEQSLSGQEKTPGETGEALYKGLAEGYYLVYSQAQPGEFAPFILKIPTQAGDKTIYDVQAEPKTDGSGDSKDPSEPPVIGPVIPQTGNIQWPKYLLLILGAVLIVAGLAEAFRGLERRHQ